MGIKQMNLFVSNPFSNGVEMKKCTRLDAAVHTAKCMAAALKADLAGYILETCVFDRAGLAVDEEKRLPFNYAKLLLEELGDDYYSAIENICQVVSAYHYPLSKVLSGGAVDVNDGVLAGCSNSNKAQEFCRYHICEFEDRTYGLNPWHWYPSFGLNIEGAVIPEAFKVCTNPKLNAVCLDKMGLQVADKIINRVEITEDLIQRYVEQSLVYGNVGHTYDESLFLIAEAALLGYERFYQLTRSLSNGANGTVRIAYHPSGCEAIPLHGAEFKADDWVFLMPYIEKLNAEGVKCELSAK